MSKGLGVFSGTAVDVAKVIFFEQWLRFYFIISPNDDETLFLEVPEDIQSLVRKSYSDFSGIMDALNGKEVEHQAALAILSEALAQFPDASTILSDRYFQLELSIFSTWLQNNENELDATVISFDEWLEHYSSWRKSSSIENYVLSLKGDEPDSAPVIQ